MRLKETSGIVEPSLTQGNLDSNILSNINSPRIPRQRICFLDEIESRNWIQLLGREELQDNQSAVDKGDSDFLGARGHFTSDDSCSSTLAFFYQHCVRIWPSLLAVRLIHAMLSMCHQRVTTVSRWL